MQTRQNEEPTRPVEARSGARDRPTSNRTEPGQKTGAPAENERSAGPEAEFERRMAIVDEIMERDREVLAALAK